MEGGGGGEMDYNYQICKLFDWLSLIVLWKKWIKLIFNFKESNAAKLIYDFATNTTIRPTNKQ